MPFTTIATGLALTLATAAPVLWIGTWGAAPVRANAQVSFADVTLREVVHVSIGGANIRIRLTNRFGERPLRIGGAAIALERVGALPVSNTERTVTFSAADSITIPPHADVLSDPVSLDVLPESNVLVDLYLPQPTGPATEHTLAYQTNYSAAGNRVGSASAEPFARSRASWYFLDGVDVTGTVARGAVVALGDSITDGAGGTIDANDRWPDFLAARLLALPARQRLAVVNEGISGNRILLDSAVYGVNALARFDSDVLSQSGVRDVIVLLGINDIQQIPHQYQAARIEQGLRQLVLLAHDHGMRVIGCTITPYAGWVAYDADGEAARAAVNRFIRHSGVFDAVVDFDAIVRDPNDPHRLLPAYDSGDHLHPNSAGHRAMADAVDVRNL